MCNFCKIIRENEHDLYGCTCKTCHKNVHFFQENICSRCGFDSRSIIALVPKLGYAWKQWHWIASFDSTPGWSNYGVREIDEISKRIDIEIFTALPALKESVICRNDKDICRITNLGNESRLVWDFDNAQGRKSIVLDGHDYHIDNDTYQFRCKGDETIICRFNVRHDGHEKILVQSAEKLRKKAKALLSQIYGYDTYDQD